MAALQEHHAITLHYELCHTKDGVNWFCKNCVKNMCDHCKKMHPNIPSLRSHTIVTVGEGWVIDRSKHLLCETHGERLHHRCNSCSGCHICIKCIADQHRTHQTTDLDKEADDIKLRFDDFLNQKREDIKHIENQGKQLEEDIKKYDSDMDGTIREIKQRFEDIKQLKDRMIENIEAKRKQDHARYENHRSVLVAKRSELQTKIAHYAAEINSKSITSLSAFAMQAEEDIGSVRVPLERLKLCEAYKIDHNSAVADERHIFGTLYIPRNPFGQKEFIYSFE